MTDAQAALMVACIQQLYQVEHLGADLDPPARGALRRDQSVPVLAQIDAVRQDLARTVLPKSPLGDAVRYLTNQLRCLRFGQGAGLLMVPELQRMSAGKPPHLFEAFDGHQGGERLALPLAVATDAGRDRSFQQDGTGVMRARRSSPSGTSLTAPTSRAISAPVPGKRLHRLRGCRRPLS